MHLPLLTEITTIFALSVLVLFLCSRARIPTIVGFLITGVLAGPHGLGLIKNISGVEALAEFGVVLLLFTIGIEFSLKSLAQIKRTVLLGGSLQVSLTILLTFLVASWAGEPFGRAIFMGFLVSISSTVIMLKILQSRAEADSPHGRAGLGISIFQDISSVVMILVAPLLAGAGGEVGKSLAFLVGKGVLVIALVVVSARWIVPSALYRITQTRSRELFLLGIVVICFAVAWLTSSIGLSLALGAFLAGLIISESEYAEQALGNITPFRDVFTSFFFISIGMLLNIGFVADNLSSIAIITALALIIKAAAAGVAVAALGLPLRITVLTGLLLAQVGEFSFVLSRTGIEYGLLGGDIYQMFLSVSVLTMALSPLIMALAPAAADLIMKLPLSDAIKSGANPNSDDANGADSREAPPRDHIIVVGFGVNGRNLSKAAKAASIPYTIIEANSQTVRAERAKGEPIRYGDATQEATLRRAGITEARVMVIAISDAAATRQIVAEARVLNPTFCIIARTRFVQEVKPLYGLGANEVIPEEFETSVEIFTRVLTKYLISRGEIEKFIAEIRSDGYEMFRSYHTHAPTFSDLTLSIPDVEICSLKVDKRSPVVGLSLAEIKPRTRYGVTVLAVRREGEILSNPAGDARLLGDDVIITLGKPEEIAEFARLFQ
ncbi:MAG: cation:proton antiporter domain-containing protein [Deltaproteobacteria bacterium]